MASKKVSKTQVSNPLISKLSEAAGLAAVETADQVVSELRTEVTEDSSKPVVLKALSRWDAEVLSRPSVVARLEKIGPEGRAYKCLICGKILISDDSQEFGAGHRCDEVVQMMTSSQWEEHYASRTVEKLPEGMVRLNVVYDTVRWYGRSAGAFLEACGDDRSAGAEATILVLYYKGSRYVPAEHLTPEYIKSLPVNPRAKRRDEWKPKYAVEVEGL